MNHSDQLGALAHESRLALFRLLMRRFPEYVPAGELSDAIGAKANTTSVYLGALMRAGLISQKREGRSLLYRVDMAGARGLVEFLFVDCCRGRPDICLTGDEGFEDTGSRQFNVLFICSGNSARSIFAETLLRDIGGGQFKAYSAGTNPASGLNPRAVEVLTDKGHNIAGLRAKHTDEFRAEDAPVMDFVFTVCDHSANEDCPAWPGQPMTAHWGVPDPVKATGTEAEQQLAFQQAYGVLKNRITAFSALDIAALERLALQQHLDDIALKEDLTS